VTTYTTTLNAIREVLMTEKLHFDDLTQITAPFGLLDDDTQARLKAWPHGWECFDKRGWKVWEPYWAFTATYRAKPAPLTQDTVPWEQIPKWAKAAARDADGMAYVFAETPVVGGTGWGSSKERARIDNCHAGYQRGTCHWKDSLQFRPEGV